MIIINTVSDNRFTFNGVTYFRNFTPFVTGNKVSIVNAYNSCISLTDAPTIYSDFVVDGVTYANVNDLQIALLPIVYTRSSLLGFTPENVANKATNLTSPDDTKYPTTLAVSTALSGKQDTLTNPITGTGTTNYVSKFTGSGTLGNSLIFDNGTNVGIGTTSPLERFHVSGGDVLIDNNRWFRVRSADGTSQRVLGVDQNNTVFMGGVDAQLSTVLFRTSAVERMRLTGTGLSIGATTVGARLDVRAQGALSTDIAFRVRNSADNNDLIRVQGNGNIGIGTTVPTERLQVSGNAIINDLLIARRNNVLTGNSNGVIFQTDGTAGGIRPSESSHLVFQTRSNTDRDIIMVTGATPAERMTIKGNGNIGIATTAPTSRLHVVGLPSYADNAAAIAGGLTVGAFYHTAGILKVVI